MKRNLTKRIVISDRINDLRCVKATKCKLVAWNHKWMKKNIAFGCRCRSFAITETVCIRTDTCTSIARNVRVYLLESCQPFDIPVAPHSSVFFDLRERKCCEVWGSQACCWGFRFAWMRVYVAGLLVLDVSRKRSVFFNGQGVVLLGLTESWT